MEETKFIVPIGYLGVLLGNLCLDATVHGKVGARLPNGRMDVLVQKIREFIRYNQTVDRLTGRFEGREGEQTHRNFTQRLASVVDRLDSGGGGGD